MPHVAEHVKGLLCMYSKKNHSKTISRPSAFVARQICRPCSLAYPLAIKETRCFCGTNQGGDAYLMLIQPMHSASKMKAKKWYQNGRHFENYRKGPQLTFP